MELVFYLIGAAATLLFILNNIVRTLRRQKEMRVLEIALAFFVVLMPAAALLLDNLNNPIFSTLENLMFLLILPLTIFSIGLTVVELFRKERLRQSRGLLGLGAALLLVLVSFSYNILALNAQNNAVQQNRVPTPVNSTSNIDPCEVAFQTLIVGLINRIADESNLSLEELFTLVEEQPELSIASLIEANGGNPVVFTQSVIAQLREAVRDLLARGCLDSGQATAIIGALPLYLPNIIYNDFSQLQELFQTDADPNLSPTEIQGTRIALLESLNQEPSPLPTLTHTPTPSRTPSPTPTRTPRPVDSATPTLSRFITNTPTLTPTLPNPCLGSAIYNVNLRTYPDLEESEVLITIPFEATITIYAPNADKTWWFGLYEGETGWISSEFIHVSSACNELPARRP